MSLPCRCGHAESLHTRAWGPNSIGQYGHGLCMDGWVTAGNYEGIGPYVFERANSCYCARFKASLWRALTIRLGGGRR